MKSNIVRIFFFSSLTLPLSSKCATEANTHPHTHMFGSFRPNIILLSCISHISTPGAGDPVDTGKLFTPTPTLLFLSCVFFFFGPFPPGAFFL